MNSVNLVGNLVADAKEIKSHSGSEGREFRLAVNDRVRRGQGETTAYENVTDYLPVFCYGTLAKNLGDRLKRGCRVAVSGKVRSYSVRNPDGTFSTSVTIFAERLDILNNAPVREEAAAIGEATKTETEE